MKKTYQAPQMEVVNLKVNSLLMVSGEVGTTGVKMSWDDTANTDEEGLARGTSFWDE